MESVWYAIVDGLTYDVVKYVIGSVIVTGAVTTMARFVLDKLRERKELMQFCAACFVAVFTLLLVFAPRSQRPELSSGLLSAVSAAVNNEKDTVFILSMNVMNTGSMQTIIKNWDVEASINGSVYHATFPPMPPIFTVNIPDHGPSYPASLTYHSEDNLIYKGMVPLQGGAILPGILFVLFENVPASVFASGADITVNFEDALSKRYSATIKTSAQFQPVGASPGTHTDMVCRMPSGTPYAITPMPK